jgi:hypothetical protein
MRVCVCVCVCVCLCVRVHALRTGGQPAQIYKLVVDFPLDFTMLPLFKKTLKYLCPNVQACARTKEELASIGSYHHIQVIQLGDHQR